MTRDEARDEMFRHVTESVALVDTPPDILWPDTPQDIPAGQTWIRPTIRHAGGSQASLSNQNGIRQFKHYGVLMVQCFSPVGDGMVSSDKLVQTMLTYFETVKSSPVWYRNIRAIEIGKSGAAEQVNFMADFQYDISH